MIHEEKIIREEKMILDATTYFINKIGDGEINILKNTLLPKIDKRERDYLNGIFNTLSKAQDVLKDDVLSRATGKLSALVEETIANLKMIEDDIRLHDEKERKDKFIPKIEIMEDGKKLVTNAIIYYAKNHDDIKLVRREGKKIQSDSCLILDTHNRFKCTKKDIIKLAYYELEKLYKECEIKNFKDKAIKILYYKFDINLAHDKLKISLTKISSFDKTYVLPLSQDIPKEKLSYPTFGITL